MKITIALLLLALTSPPVAIALDTESLGVVASGSAEGKARVAVIESQLAAMTIKSGHPRIHLTDQLIARGRARAGEAFSAWDTIKASAANITNGDQLACAAFAYLMLAESDPTAASVYVQRVYDYIVAQPDIPPITTTDYDKITSASVYSFQKAAWWALAYDWTYNGLTPAQRSTLETKISTAANISGRAAWIRAGNKFTGGTGQSFHREEWVWGSYRAWPEIALAGHVTDADFNYKSRWNFDWIYGDALRTWAYLDDGSNVEGYQLGAEGVAWFLALKSATGINIVDGPDVSYGKKTADFVLYNTDLAQSRRIMHYGVNGSSAAHSWSWGVNAVDNWKPRSMTCQATQLGLEDSPYHQFFMQSMVEANSSTKPRCPSHWVLGEMKQSSDPDATQPILSLLYFNPSDTGTNPATATCEQLPCGKFFAGAGDMNSRTSWGADAARMVQRYRPAWVRSSHSDFSMGDFVLYRKGNLAPDAGIYDVSGSQLNYIHFKKNTVAHNTMLIVDPAHPTWPYRGGSASPSGTYPFDPGGVNWVITTNLGTRNDSQSRSFLHRPTADSKVLQQVTTPLYDYITGDTVLAYGDQLDPGSTKDDQSLYRVTESTRSTMFLRSGGDKAYVLVLDRINSNKGAGNYKKKWLIHTTTEPTVSGSVTNTEVADHVYTLDGSTWSASNAQGTSAMYGKILYPTNPSVRKVGGTGYEFWVDGATGNAATSGENKTVDWNLFRPQIEALTGNPMEEAGTWRLEISPPTIQPRDVFLNVIYMGDVGETMADTSMLSTSLPDRVGVFIKHSAADNYAIFFNKAKFKTALNDDFAFTMSPTSATTAVKFIITEVAPRTTYAIGRSGNVVGSAVSSADGILEFTQPNASGEWSITPVPVMPITVPLPANYYVSPSGDDANNDGKSPGRPWKSVSKVNATTFAPGDVIRFDSGDYGTTTLTPQTSGSPGNPITFASYFGTAGDKPVLRGGVNLSGRSYVTVDGFDISSSGNAVLISGGSHNIVRNSKIYSSATSWVNGVQLRNGAHYNQIVGNTITQASGNNDLIDLRNDTNYNLIANNDITIENSHAAIDLEGWTVDVGTTPITGRSSNWNIIRGNTVTGHNGGGALINLNANSNYNTVDNNTLRGDSTVGNFCNLNPQPALHQDMFKLVGQYNIARNNTLNNYPCKDSMGIEMSPYGPYDGFTNNSRYQHVYHNVITGIGVGATPLYLYGNNGGDMRDNVIKNNIIANNGGTYWQTDSNGSTSSDSGNMQLRDTNGASYFFNNIIYKSGYSGPLVWLGTNYLTVDQANATANWDGNISADPLLNTAFLPAAVSQALNGGANLTTITSASNSTGATSFTVADAYYFCDGNGITTGDTIMVGNQVTTITEITYGTGLTGTLTVSPAITWAQGDAVNLPYDGAAPSIGLATYESTDITAPTTTISPDAKLYTTAQTVYLSTEPGATIYYTLDNSDPTTGSAVYSGPLVIGTTTTIKYFARDAAGNNEIAKAATYTISFEAPATSGSACTTASGAFSLR